MGVAASASLTGASKKSWTAATKQSSPTESLTAHPNSFVGGQKQPDAAFGKDAVIMPSDGGVLCLIGTQSFTAEALAEQFSDLLESMSVDMEVMLLNEYDYASNLAQEARPVIFLVSTYGDGDPPASAMGFASWLKTMSCTDDRSGCLSGIHFSVFGLGDRHYAHFAAFGTFVDATMEALGASRFHSFGTGDAGKGATVRDFHAWMQPCIASLKALPSIMSAPLQKHRRKLRTDKVLFRSSAQGGCFFVKLVERKELCEPSANKSTLHIRFESSVLPSYLPGDHLAIYPVNSSDLVERCLNFLPGVEAAQPFTYLCPAQDGTWQERQSSVAEILRSELDLTGRCGEDTLRALIPFITSLEMRALARDITHVSSSGGDRSESAYAQWEDGRFLSVLDLMGLFDCAPTFDAFARAAPRMAPRLYSIASTPHAGKDSLALCVAVADRGLCTNWLATMALGTPVRAFHRTSGFHPAKIGTPMLMFASGSGVGPFVGFLQHQLCNHEVTDEHPAASKVKKQGSCDSCAGQAHSKGPGIFQKHSLYTGYRTSCMALYSDVLQDFRERGLWWTPVLSREAGSDGPKVYVQDYVQRHGMELWSMLSAPTPAVVYLCGRLDMANAVRSALLDLAQTHGRMSLEGAMEWLKTLEASGGLLTDAWEVASSPDACALGSEYVLAHKQKRPKLKIEYLSAHHSCDLKYEASLAPSIDLDVSSVPPWPSYLRLLASGEFEKRVKRAVEMFSACVSCGRECEVDRISEDPKDWGECRVGSKAIVYNAFPHFGEEDCLRGTKGSGTIFFGACNLKCVYCQNWEVSAMDEGTLLTDEELAAVMLKQQRRGCHNVNFVSPTHNVLAIMRASFIAARKGLKLPLVWNTGGYDTVASLRLLEGIIDIYMPDMKYANRTVARKLSKIDNYPEVNQSAVKEMHRQVGHLRFDKKGLATRGVLVRHLVLPEGLAGTQDVARFLSKEISPQTYVNIMEQYRPEHLTEREEKWSKYGLHRNPTRIELDEARNAAEDEGLVRFDDRADIERFNRKWRDNLEW